MENAKINGNRLKFALIFEIFMSVFYITFAYVLTFTGIFEHLMTKTIRITLGSILFIYGIYRVYRAVKNIKRAKNREEQ